MTEKVYVVTDIGPGDGGKGGIVHRLATLMPVHTIVKRGGAQGSHGVHTNGGKSYNFSQWGCATFEEIPTFLSEQMIVSPEGLLNEAAALRELGVSDPFSLISADENALVATSFHGISSHIKELARGDHPRGTIGTGIGESYRDLSTKPELAIRVRDIFRSDIDDRLESVFVWQRKKLLPIIEKGTFLTRDIELLEKEKSLLFDDMFLQYETARFRQVAALLRTSNLADILSLSGCTIIECSHGVLNDSERGFQPHVSAIRTIPEFTMDMLHKSAYEGPIVNLAVHRAYAVRHGAGPLPTADTEMSETLLPGSSKDSNRWQGQVRVGPLDFVQMRKALNDSLPVVYNGLALTWFDQIKKNGIWKLCDGYDKNGIPVIESVPIPQNLSKSELFDFAAEVVASYINVPVRMVSFGPTEKDKVLK